MATQVFQESSGKDEHLAHDLSLRQRVAALTWCIALPVGWLLGWGIGAALGQTYPRQFGPASQFMDWSTAQRIARAETGLHYGPLGVMVALVLAAIVSFYAMVPRAGKVKAGQLILVLLAWILPWGLVMLAFYYVMGV